MGRLNPPHPLTRHHNLSQFDCGNASLNEWLYRRALKNENSGASRTFVVCEEDKKIVGYYCLSTGAVEHEDSSGSIRRNMPEPIPVMVLGRLAVDGHWQKQGIASGLLKDAILRTMNVSQQVGVRALLVHALSEQAKSFYLKHGFHESPTNSMTLMISVKEAIKAAL